MRTLCVGLAALVLTACTGPSFERFYSRGDTLLGAKRYAEAAIEFQNATRTNPESAGAQFKLAEAYEGLGRPAHAAAAYQRACELERRAPDTCVQAAAALVRLGDYVNAITVARSALAIDRDNFDAQLLLGSALGGVRRFTEAEERLAAAIAASPDSPRGYQALGELQRQRGNAKAAEATLRRALDLDAASTAARVSLSNVYLDQGRRADGERELKAALASNPSDVEANRAYGSYLVATDQCADAEPYWRKVADASADLSGTLSLADYYVWSGRPQEAVRVLNAVPQGNDGDGAARTRLATILYDQGDRQRASTLVETLLAGDQANVPGLLLKARIKLDEGDSASARDLAHRAAQIAPGSSAVRQMLAKLSAPER